MAWTFSDYGDSVAALDDHGTSLTYTELEAEGDELAAALGGRCLVFALCTNTLGSLLGYTAFIRHHAVPLLLSAEIDPTLLDNLVAVYDPAYLWAPAAHPATALGEVVCEVRGYALVRRTGAAAHEHNDALALLLTTSGSTGSPKLVRQSYDNVFSNATSIASYLELDATERPITTLPMNYTYGLSIINSHLLVGATLLLTERGPLEREFWKFFREQGATSFGGVPYTYEILERLRFRMMSLPSLRTMTQAGGKLSVDLHERFAAYAAEQGKRFVVMYGQAEATARMGYLPAERAIEKRGSMGIAIPGGTLELIDVDGSVISELGVVGELVYRGPNVTLGYAQCAADLALGDERHGVLQTGDMARFDEDGFFYITGRKKRFLKVFGNRVNLDELDRIAAHEFEGLECTCAGTDDHVVIYVTDEARAEDVRHLLSERTRLNLSAFSVRVIDAIPRNEAGKVLYKELPR